jgi:hypothetical protein
MLQKFALVAGLLWSVADIAASAEAGRVVFVTGQAQVGARAAVQDVAVQEGDQITTGADGYIYVKTVDNGFLILRPNSKARVVAYAIDKADPSKTQVKLELQQGVARAISGQGVQQAKQNFRFNTPVAAIGVRGTDFTVYTDQQTTRVSVVSGGVVMSGFNASCSAAGTGPCEGRDAKELFAGQRGLLLQVERGSSIPLLLQNPALAPDQNSKPRADEPVAKQAAPSVPMAQVNLDPQRTERSLQNARPVAQPAVVAPMPEVPVPDVVTPPPVVIVEPPAPAPTPLPVPVPDPVPVPVVPIKPSVPEIFWGRWQAIAGAPVLPIRGNDDVDVATLIDRYSITRLTDTAFVMPKEGTAAFKLIGGEAIMTIDNSAQMANIESGKLNMDFSTRTFGTSLVVTGAGHRADVSGFGVMTNTGRLYEERGSNTIIRGYLGGANAEQAGYIFKNSANPGITVTGATLWNR